MILSYVVYCPCWTHEHMNCQLTICVTFAGDVCSNMLQQHTRFGHNFRSAAEREDVQNLFPVHCRLSLAIVDCMRSWLTCSSEHVCIAQCSHNFKHVQPKSTHLGCLDLGVAWTAELVH